MSIIAYKVKAPAGHEVFVPPGLLQDVKGKGFVVVEEIDDAASPVHSPVQADKESTDDEVHSQSRRRRGISKKAES